MDSFQITLILSTLFCSLVAGFLLAFAVVVMPGIKHLKNGAFIRAFQVMDRIIQDNQPVFMLLWVGSIVALVVSTGWGMFMLEGFELALLLIASGFYLLAVQLPTIVINIPLNNQLQRLDVESMEDDELEAAREAFEARWNKWNRRRTVVACLVSTLLLVLTSLR